MLSLGSPLIHPVVETLALGVPLLVLAWFCSRLLPRRLAGVHRRIVPYTILVLAVVLHRLTFQAGNHYLEGVGRFAVVVWQGTPENAGPFGATFTIVWGLMVPLGMGFSSWKVGQCSAPRPEALQPWAVQERMQEIDRLLAPAAALRQGQAVEESPQPAMAPALDPGQRTLPGTR